MAENESTLFRKSSLERVSSPDQLNEYVKVTNPSLILMLVGVFVILITGFVWIFSGVIPEKVTINGVVATSSTGKEGVYCLVPIGESKRLSEGMEVQISPSYVNSEQYGYIKGNIRSVGTKVVTTDFIRSNFKKPEVFSSLLSTLVQDNYVVVSLSMGEWSNKAGEKFEINEGSICSVSVVVGGTRPYELIFNKN